MNQETEMLREREYTAHVQQLLLAVVSRYKDYAQFHDENIHLMLSDAWEELRMKPTALSPQDLEQLAGEIDRVLARKTFSAEQVARYERMMLSPFFARVDFLEQGEQHVEKIVIGLYSLKDENGNLLVHDWRAPVCSLYYDSTPGLVSYQSPSGEIAGRLTLKRQYRMEDGRLRYFVDTDVSIDDELLLDILSRATSTHMRSIVSTIQREQNAAIRREDAEVLSVIGGAGSGKTSVAMHRVAYLMYRQRNLLDANRIAILSPGSAFSEYISNVLPDLGEDNVQTVTLSNVFSQVIGLSVEAPAKQVERLLGGASDSLRRQSIRFKSDVRFSRRLEEFCQRFRDHGPKMDGVSLGKYVLVTREELWRMYHVEFTLLNPALRLIRIQSVLTARLEAWERTLKEQYESRLRKSFRGKDLDMAVRMSISQQLQPIKAQLRAMLKIDPLILYAEALKNAPEALYQAAKENAAAGVVWWEDAPGVAFLMLKLGFATPSKQILHLLIDEAQDYSDVALRALHQYYPSARVTLLGDPKQRTLPGMSACDAKEWGDCFGHEDAPVITLEKCYRSTLEITRLCNAILPLGAHPQAFGREGAIPPEISVYSFEELKKTLDSWQEKGLKALAVITRSQAEAALLARRLHGSILLTGDDDDMLPEAGGVVVASYQQTKGLEFDGVACVWPEKKLTDGERRRLYTACSRALHALSLLTTETMIQELGIVL